MPSRSRRFVCCAAPVVFLGVFVSEGHTTLPRHSATRAGAPTAVRMDTVPCTEAALRASAASAQPARVSLAQGRVSLVPPEGLPQDTDPRVQERGEVVFMLHGQASFTVSHMDYPVTREQTRTLMEEMAEGGQMRWSSRTPVEIGGVRWERLAYTGAVLGPTQQTEIYIAPFQGGTLMVNASATPSTESRWRPRMAASITSLEVRDCRLMDGESTVR
jgi:hypothetical protein